MSWLDDKGGPRNGRACAWRAVAVAGLAVLAACGSDGGGGVSSTPAPTVTSSPTPTATVTAAPTPTATPTTSAYDTTEYRATVGAVSMNALAAYNAGATGAGVTVGIIDTGIDTTSAEFGGRISAASQNVAGGSGIADQDGHGTAVAFTLGGRANGVATQGVAFQSTLLVLRADTPGTCGGSASSGTSTCSFNDDNIAKAIDVARVNGARVVNMSLGGNDYSSAALIAAANRATAAGIVLVVAAGNDGGANPENSAQFANDDATARNLVIVAGSITPTLDSKGNITSESISSFSNRAGNTATHFLTAVGNRVQAPDQKGTSYLWSGTSFAVPQIAGAVALLAQAFPNLTGAQIVGILYQSARDAGAAGVDPIYGEGVLDLTRAFQPLGTLSMAGSTVPVSETSNGALSSAMGDATAGTLGTVILDGYQRAFAVDLGRTLIRATPAPTLAPALTRHLQGYAAGFGGTAVAMTLTARPNGDVILSRFAMSGDSARAATALAATVTQRLGKRLSFGMGLSQGASAVTAQLAGQTSSAFLIAQDDGLGFDGGAHASSAMRATLGRFGVAAATETGDVLSRKEASLAGIGWWRRSPYTRTSLTLDRRFGPLAAMVTGSFLDERDTVLGAHFDASLGAAHATSLFADARVRLELGRGWTMGGSWRRGWTNAAVTIGAGGSGMLRSETFAGDVGKDGVFGHDSFGLRVAQPLRVMRGSGLDLVLPTDWDYASGTVSAWASQRMNLAPTGRELDVEARYARPWLGGLIQTNLFWRREPGNIAGYPADYGWALRWSTGF